MLFKTFKIRAVMEIEYEAGGLNKEQAVQDFLRIYPLPIGVIADSFKVVEVTKEKI